jgi:hypothetical protein
MAANNSISLTRKVVITSAKTIAKEDFIKKIVEITESMLLYLKNNGCEKLGHLKLISTTNGEDYLQISAADTTKKPVIKGMLNKTFVKIKLTLNIIEFGVSKEDIVNKIDEEMKNIQDYFNSM